MKKKKRELIEILLDNITPDDWPEDAKFAAQDKKSLAWGKNKLMFYKQDEPPFVKTGATIFSGDASGDKIALPELCKHWSKTIVHRDEFMKRWNERNQIEAKTLTFSREGIESFTVTENMEKITIKPNADSEGWIQWNGGEMPVEKGTLIDVRYRDRPENIGVKAGVFRCTTGSNSSMNASRWDHRGVRGDIIAYRIHKPQQQKTPQQLALEKFGTDWHDNEGVQPVDDEVLIDAIVDGVTYSDIKMTKCTWKYLVSGAFEIKKWRIHSDEKELLIGEKEKTLEWLSQPMPPCSAEIPCHFVDVKSPLETQIGGDHYTKLAIQPMQYSMKNGLDPLQHTVIKYVTRFRDKAGIEDLEKAKHCIDMLIEFEKEQK